MTLNTFYRRNNNKSRSCRSLISHGRHLDFDYRIIGLAAGEGWKMRIQVLRAGQRVDAFSSEEIYGDFERLRIAGMLLAHRMIDRIAGQESGSAR